MGFKKLRPDEPLPAYLKAYVVEQDPALYTPSDHASWRYILKLSQAFYSKHAHPKYLDGLRETGISTERIPLIGEMNEKLNRFGWRAVAVSGFIPPAVFLEFQAHGILAIACDMRQSEHIAYTPAPDIVHEAAGHAPIVADPEYRDYLLRYGEVARNAIFSDKDLEVYEAIRHLSEVKENPASSISEIQAAEKRLDRASADQCYTSEASAITRMAWWTVEYGMVGPLENPLLYGAGLLSSVGESYHAFDSQVKKVPFTLDCLHMGYDITRPQPQLFVAPNFQVLREGLDAYAKTMAYQRGGIEGIAKAHIANTVTTTVLDSGLQISGILTEYLLDETGKKPIFLKWTGPVQLAENEIQIPEQGPKVHAHGFSTPLGKIQGLGKSSAELSATDWQSLGFSSGKKAKLHFESGFVVEGILIQIIQSGGKNQVVRFDQCTIRRGDTIFYRPEWGTFDLACGQSIPSVFGGAADRSQYQQDAGIALQTPAVQKTNAKPENQVLNLLYQTVRDHRVAARNFDPTTILLQLKTHYPEDWLLKLELLELALLNQLGNPQQNSDWIGILSEDLKNLAEKLPSQRELILRGLKLFLKRETL